MPATRNARRFRLGFIAAAISSAALLSASHKVTAAYQQVCAWEQTETYICMTDVGGTRCWWDRYYDYVCRWMWVPDPPPDIPPPPPDPVPGDPGPPGSNFRDVNYDGTIDSWDEIVETADPCAQNFDTNDRLGTQSNGPNTIRPGHLGVDIQCDNGDNIYNAFGGQVTRVNKDNPGAACGFWVEVSSSGGRTATYCHLLSISATVGQILPAGGRIGFCDSTGNSTGPHLHLVLSEVGTRQEYFEYFWYTNYIPRSWNLNPNGC